MDEQTPEISFGKTDHLYSITKGYVIVKKNIITGSIIAKGDFAEETVRAKTMKLMELSDAQLSDLLARAQNKGITNHIATFQAEIDRRAQGLAPIPGISDRAIKMPGKSDLIRRRISAKLGIKFRWPWQSVLVLPTTERKIDTPMMSVDTTDGIRLQFDTDYHYKIIDPEAFATEFNSREENAGARAFSMIEKDIGGKLDELVRRYMKEHISEIQSKPTIDLLSELYYDVSEKTKMYGIEITSLLVKDIKLPDNVVQAEAERKAAQAKADAARQQQQVEASKEAMQMQSKIEYLRQAFPNLSDEQVMQFLTQMIAAGTITTNINAGGVPFMGQPMPAPVQQPVQQSAPAPTNGQPAPTQSSQPEPAPQPVRPANVPEWFDDYVGIVYDESGKILAEVWDYFKQNHPNALPFAPKVTIMSPDLFDELCKELNLNPPVRGQQR